MCGGKWPLRAAGRAEIGTAALHVRPSALRRMARHHVPRGDDRRERLPRRHIVARRRRRAPRQHARDVGHPLRAHRHPRTRLWRALQPRRVLLLLAQARARDAQVPVLRRRPGRGRDLRLVRRARHVPEAQHALRRQGPRHVRRVLLRGADDAWPAADDLRRHQGGQGRADARGAVHHRGLLVLVVHVVREPCGDHRPVVHRHVREHFAQVFPGVLRRPGRRPRARLPVGAVDDRGQEPARRGQDPRAAARRRAQEVRRRRRRRRGGALSCVRRE
mmetsp:Transcript_25159/g.78493  ORF Transcript_25159/g.78493 Transcript_25159/m.78493 type:complete len:275 (+) Transcript_25159:131-955(+)